MSSGFELLERHVESFNDGIRTGRWDAMMERFSDDADLVFEGVPAGRSMVVT